MRVKTFTGICMAVVATTIATSTVWAARKPAAPVVPLSTVGQKLEAQYAVQREAMQAEISRALPALDAQKKAAYLEAREAEKAAVANANAKQEALSKNKGHMGLLNHRKGWIGRATKGVAEAKETLKQAEAMSGDAAAKAKAVTAAREGLAKIQENYDMAASELKKSQDAVDAAKLEEPRVAKELEVAQKALAKAQANTLNAVEALGLKPFLASDTLDGKLAKYVILTEATPRGLAEFAQQGRAQELVKTLLADADLMKQMVVADGARGGKYGQAMKIYSDIQKASKKAGEGALQRLALAVSLVHAVPVGQRNATGMTDAPPTVDPVKRYLHFEKAFLAGELDPAFEGFAVWDYRMVVDGEEPDEILAWGREMLRNYRPDHISMPDYRWRYVAAVRTEIRYGSQCNKFDKPELQFFQNILMNGGVCGRRAFFGRFILRAFGVPTTARPQPGHAALTHWTPDGWVVCLGAGWGAGTTRLRYTKDLDFLANTQARENEEAYLQVKRAQWIGDVMGETPAFGFLSGDPDFWYGVSLYRQRTIIEEAKAMALAAVGEELGEANESDVKYDVEAATVTEADRKITVSNGGEITIPAVACSKPTKSTGRIIFMPSNLGGKQLHYSRTGNDETFEYIFDAPKGGTYALTARVVTPSWNQSLTVTANGAEPPVEIALPFTVGMWEQTEPVEIALVKGKNVLVFSRDHEWLKGVTIRDFTLTPVVE